MSNKEWEEEFRVNVMVPWILTKMFLPYIPKGGAILFVSSVAAYNPGGSFPVYGISKLALNGLSFALAKELAPKGIRVNTLNPGPIHTPNADRAQLKVPGYMDWASNQTFVKRMGSIEEMGSTAAFLLSDEASFIIGEAISASGGMGARL